jgi:hypothetical protein
MYKIKINYTTGDSFHSEIVEEFVDMEWESLKLAQEALKRIEEHYRWYQSRDNSRYKKKDETIRPSWHKLKEEDCIVFRLDNGEDFEFWPPWIGYFEIFHWAEIVCDLGRFDA